MPCIIRSLALVATTAFLGLPAPAGASSLTSLAEAMAELDTTNAVGRTFDLTCLLCHVPAAEADRNNRQISLREGRQYGEAFFDKRLPLSAGMTARLIGHTRLSTNGWKVLQVDRAEVLGRGRPPEPSPATALEILSGEKDYQDVIVTGFVADIIDDDVDERFEIILLRAQNGIVKVYRQRQPPEIRARLLDAEVEVIGQCQVTGMAARAYTSRFLRMASKGEAVRIITPPPSSPFAAKMLEPRQHSHAPGLANSGKRRADGTVLAAWAGNQILIRMADERIVSVRLRGERPALPIAGEKIAAVGYPTTDFYTVILTDAIWQSIGSATGRECETEIESRQLMKDVRGASSYDSRWNGRLVRMRGTIHGLPTSDARFLLRDQSGFIAVDASATPELLDELKEGCRVAATGICFMETETWSPERSLPRIKGFCLILRNADDLHIISYPSWWTRGRLLIVIGSLFALILASIVWALWLNRLVERRSRALVREQLAHRTAEARREDRTRLAVELHDSISQSLAAVTFQVSSAKNATPDAESVAKAKLTTAEKMLDSCRKELKNCLSDLRSNILEELNLESAIRQVTEPICGDADIQTDIRISRSRLTDSVAHALLMIVRELVANAVYHGKATSVRICGDCRSDLLTLSVGDNGCGFDPARRLTTRNGHFGLDGIHQRLKHLNGDMTIDSAPGQGTKISISLSLKAD